MRSVGPWLLLAFVLVAFVPTRSLALDPTDEAIMSQWIALQSQLPPTWSNISNICTDWEGIDCDNNHITSVFLTTTDHLTFSCLAFDLPNLKRLRLYGESGYVNKLESCANLCEGGRTFLTELVLNNFDFGGSLPAGLAQCSNLTTLDLSNCKLTGKIPPELFSGQPLTFVGLANNHLTGSIPASLLALPKLSNLFLAWNELTGTIPNVTPSPDLANLYLTRNYLHGEIPIWVFPIDWNYLSFASNNVTCPTQAQLALAPASSYDLLFTGLQDCRAIASSLPVQRNSFFYPTRVSFSANPDFTPDYEFGSEHLRIQVKGPDFYIFAVTASGEVLREEYCVCTAQAVQQSDGPPEQNMEIPITHYNAPLIEQNGDLVTIATTLEGGAIFSFIFEFNPTNTSFLKFSFTLENLTNSNVLPTYLPIQWTIRSPQSETGNDFEYVDDVSTILSKTLRTAIFSSSVASEFGVNEAGYIGLVLDLASQSAKLATTFSFPDSYYTDGKWSTTRIGFDLVPYSLPFGSAVFLQGSQPYPTVPLEEQSYVLHIIPRFAPFNRTLLYDPIISLSALFEPSESPSAAIVDPATIIAPAVVVSVVGVAAIVTMGVYFGLRRAKQRREKERVSKALSKVPAKSQKDSIQLEKTNRWTVVVKPSSSMM